MQARHSEFVVSDNLQWDDKAKARQAIDNVNKDFRALKTVAEDCLKQIEFSDDAKKVFTTDRVQKRLRSLMDLIIEALELIHRFYLKTLFSELIVHQRVI